MDLRGCGTILDLKFGLYAIPDLKPKYITLNAFCLNACYVMYNHLSLVKAIVLELLGGLLTIYIK